MKPAPAALGRTSVMVASLIPLLALAAMLAAGPALGDQTLVISPRCVADLCPTCPQPNPMDGQDRACQECMAKNTAAILSCGSQDQGGPLDLTVVGTWRTRAGLVMRVVETSAGMRGYLEAAPRGLAKYYPRGSMLILRTGPAAPGGYQGELWAPPGKWVAATLQAGGKGMTTRHPRGNSVHWTRTVTLTPVDNSGAGTRPGQ